MRHLGDGSYGRASGRMVRSRIIADCWMVDGVVIEEWLVRDQAAFARCIGLEPKQLAQQMAAEDLRAAGRVGFYLPEHDRPGRYQPEVQRVSEITLCSQGYERLWQAKDLSAVRDLYFHAANLHAPGNDTHYGHPALAISARRLAPRSMSWASATPTS